MDADDAHHLESVDLYESDPGRWVLPWAVLPEVDYLVLKVLGLSAELAFLQDVAEGLFPIEWGSVGDVQRAHELCRRHRDLRLGLVDGVVMAVAERLGASAIATFDHRHFAAVRLKRPIRIVPGE